MSQTILDTQALGAVYFPEGTGYLLVKVPQTTSDDKDTESNVVLVKSHEGNQLCIRKSVKVTESFRSGIPTEIEFNPSFNLIPRVKDITKHMDSPKGEYRLAVCTESAMGVTLEVCTDFTSIRLKTRNLKSSSGSSLLT
jgi:hypothetical protein